MRNGFTIGSFDFKDENQIFIVAELSANHNRSLKTAVETIKAAGRAGASAIKLQTYTPDTITLDCKKEDFKIKQDTIWDGKYLYDLYKAAYTPWKWHPELFRVAKEEGLICFSSPFDITAVDFLENLDAPAFKIASFEITDIPLIEYAASKGKPMIISTGIAEPGDVELAIKTCRDAGNEKIIILKCVSSYPSTIEEANLLMIPDLSKRYNVTTGLSDHTMGITAPVVAAILGARLIEKHFIIDRSIGGPDASFSLNEDEFSEMVLSVKGAIKARGRVDYTLSEKQTKSRELCRSLYCVMDIKAGDVITHENIRSIRPGFGLHPKHYKSVLGKKVKFDLKLGDRLSFEDLDL
ncbi:MAG: pseudaminic acid synthase [Bacteroidales bacterium]|nr:pseudaminic acid synthase [Bacteroidales bacterium]